MALDIVMMQLHHVGDIVPRYMNVHDIRKIWPAMTSMFDYLINSGF